MPTNRRTWLKQLSLGAAGVGLSGLKTFAAPIPQRTAQRLGASPIRLSANENPYGPSPMARAAMMESINNSNRYSWDLPDVLQQALAAKENVSGNNILIGSGSTEILDLVARFAAGQKGNLVTAEPSFNYWTDAAERQGLRKISVPLTADKKLDLPAMQRAITADTRIVYVCNPNNPTGTLSDKDALKAFVAEASKKAIVLVDEAYIDFTDQPSLSKLTTANENIVVAKTFSKVYGLAGARVGYAIAHTDTIKKLSALQSWPNGGIGLPSLAAAIASLKDDAFVSKAVQLNAEARKFTIDHLQKSGFTCIPSHTNFVYFSLKGYPKDFFQTLQQNNIMGTRIYEADGKWTRITIGTMEEMEAFVKAVV